MTNNVAKFFQGLWNPLVNLKAAMMRFPAQGTNSLMSRIPGTSSHFARQVRLDMSAPVVACVNWILRTFPEAPIVVRAQDDEGEWEIQHEHPAALLLKRPNPFYSGVLLIMAVMGDFLIHGNGYIRKIRSEAGRVVQLWWLPAAMVEPKWPTDGSAYVSHYEYSPGGSPEKIPPEDIIHLRYGLDPHNIRKGSSPLRSVLQEVLTDNEAATFSATLLRNLGVPGIVLSPKDAQYSANPEDLKANKQWLKESFGGENRGEPIVLSGPTEVQIMSFNPQQMDLKSIRRLPEERVSAVIGIPAIVAGLGAGLDRSTFSNMKEAREMAYEGGIIPLQRIVASELTEQLLIDFEDPNNGTEMSFDTRDVRILQEDEDAKAKRMIELFKGGVQMRSESRSRLGLEVTKEDDVYIIPISVELVGPGAPDVAPEPETRELALTGAPDPTDHNRYPTGY